MKRYVRLLWILIKFKLSKSMIYSMNFWIAFFVDFILFLFHLLAFSTIFRFTDNINGWTLNQMAVFVGTFHLVDSLIMGSVFFGILNLPDRIRTGTLDLVLCKPVNPQFYISSDSFNPGSFFGVITGSAMIAYGMIQGAYPLTIPKVLGYLLLISLMFLLFYSLMLLIRSIAFFTIRIDSLLQAEDSVIEFAFRVPGSAYKGISRVIFMAVIPYGMIASVPTQFFTEGLSGLEWIWACGIPFFFFSVSRLLFRFGLSRYTSASS